MSKVGNLRAMFENKGETSPPEQRGRSPGGLSAGAAESPRPLSKIRTNFVAVAGKDGRIGLQRDPSSDSILSAATTTRKASGGETTEGDPTSAAPDKPVTSFSDRIQKAAKDSGLQMETIPQSPKATQPGGDSSAPRGAAAGQASGPAAGKIRSLEDKGSNNVPAKGQASPTDKAAGPNPRDGLNGGSNGTTERDKTKVASKPAASKEPPKTTSTRTAAGAKPVSKVPAINTTKLGVAKSASTESPISAKTPKSPTKILKMPAKTPETKVLDPQKAATPKAVSAAPGTPKTTPSMTRSASKPPPVHISPSNSLDRGIGFVKPKPKSPTRPVTLPPGLTTHTAASATRFKSASRQGGSYSQAHGTAGRPISRASAVTATSTGRPGGTLRRQSSTINRPRPSLGPPPKQTAQDHPVTKKEAVVDDNFLARMMRPTQASSSKTNEKVVTTPPRKPAVAAAAAAKRPTAPKDVAKKTVHKAEAVVKKVVPKATLDALAAGKSGKQETSKETVAETADKTVATEATEDKASSSKETENVKPASPVVEKAAEPAEEAKDETESTAVEQKEIPAKTPLVATGLDGAQDDEAPPSPKSVEHDVAAPNDGTRPATPVNVEEKKTDESETNGLEEEQSAVEEKKIDETQTNGLDEKSAAVEEEEAKQSEEASGAAETPKMESTTDPAEE